MVKLATRAGVKSPVEISAEILRALRDSRRGEPRRQARGRGGNGARVFRRCAAAGDQGRREARRPQRAAPPERADGGGDRLRPRPRDRRARTRSTISAAARSTSRFSSSRAACSKCSRRMATRRSAATTSTIASTAGCWRPPDCRRCRPEDTRALMVKAREAKENLTLHSSAPIHCDAVRRHQGRAGARRRNVHRASRRISWRRRSGPVKRALRDAGLDARGHPWRRDGRRFDADAADPESRRRILRPAAAQQSRSGPGRRAGRRDPGQRARGQSRVRRRLAAARRDSAFARARDDGRSFRKDRAAQFDDPRHTRPGIHDVQGRPDGDRDPRRAGRTREGRRLPVARPVRASRHSADAGRRRARQR